jgi:hypothetical protein
MRTLMLLVLALATAVHADTIISTGLLQVNPDTITGFALQVRCTVTNASSKPVTVNSVRFLNELGSEYPQHDFTSNCSYPNPISPGVACLHGLGKFELPDNGYIRCEVNGKGSGKSLRVFLEIENKNLATPDAFSPNFRSDVGR